MVLKNLSNKIILIKAEKIVKFHEHDNIINYFVFKNYELHRQAFKVGQIKRFLMNDYIIANIIEKRHTQLELLENSKIL